MHRISVEGWQWQVGWLVGDVGSDETLRLQSRLWGSLPGMVMAHGLLLCAAGCGANNKYVDTNINIFRGWADFTFPENLTSAWSTESSDMTKTAGTCDFSSILQHFCKHKTAQCAYCPSPGFILHTHALQHYSAAAPWVPGPGSRAAVIKEYVVMKWNLSSLYKQKTLSRLPNNKGDSEHWPNAALSSVPESIFTVTPRRVALLQKISAGQC